MTLISISSGIGVTAAVAGLASIPHLDNIGLVLLPGVLASALLFPTGIHSDAPIAFMLIAGVANVIIYSFIAAAAYRLLENKS